MGWNPLKEAEKQAKRAVDRIVNPAAEAAKRTIRWHLDKARDGVTAVRREAENGVKRIGNEVEDELRDVSKDLEKGLTEKLPELAEDAIGEALEDAEELVEKALDGLAKAITSEGLKKSRDLVKAARAELEGFRESDPELVDEIDGVGFSLKLGPIKLAYSGFYERSEDLALALDRFASEPPGFRRGPIIALVEALGPTSVDLGVSVEFALVVGSNELGCGVELDSLSLKLFTRLGDKALEAMGVPE